jgi:hypothetical protein
MPATPESAQASLDRRELRGLAARRRGIDQQAAKDLAQIQRDLAAATRSLARIGARVAEDRARADRREAILRGRLGL